MSAEGKCDGIVLIHDKVPGKRNKMNQDKCIEQASDDCFRKGDGLSAADMECTGIFPEEIWEVILGYVEHSEDIVNVLRAFPALDMAFQSKKSFWLFDQVLPHLMTKYLVVKSVQEVVDTTFSHKKEWTQSRELLKLRLVSKRWKKTVNRSLESNTDLHPPPSPAIPENHFNYNSMSSFHFGVSIFRTAHQIDAFMQQMSQHKGNPFPASSVLISTYPQFNKVSQLQVLDMLEKFGKYVLVLEIQISGNHFRYNHLELPKYLLKCLSFVPNLRSLTLAGKMNGVPNSLPQMFSENPKSQKWFPSLPNLETFNFKVDIWLALGWTNGLIGTYGKNVRNLTIPLEDYWIVDKSTHLKNLSELHLLLPYPEFGNLMNISRIENVILRSPNSRKIRKLSLSSLRSDLELNIIDLVEILAEFQFETVNLDGLILKTDSIAVAPEILMKASTTITCLSIWDNEQLTFEFLWWLPNLRFLSVHFHKADAVVAYNLSNREEIIQDQPLENRLRRYCLKAYDKTLDIPEDYSIWKEFPKLEMLRGSVEVWKDSAVLSVQYVRECGNKAFFGWRPDEDGKDGNDQEEWV